jgi:hypothetical protein
MDIAQIAYDLHCRLLGKGMRGHCHFDDLPHEEKLQWQKYATAVAAAFPPPPDKPPGTLE